MIVGSIYLGKKAQKAIRRRQAEKAAQKLTAPYDTADPSDEIQSGVPPSSPTESATSPLSAVPSHSPSELASRSSASEISHSNSAGSQNKSIEAQEYNHYVQRLTGAEEPPSYDIVMSGPTAPTSARALSETSTSSRQQSQYGPQFLPVSSPSTTVPSTFSDRFQRGCDTCITMMETFQTIYPHPHQVSPLQPQSRSLLNPQPPQNLAEMHDDSVFAQRPVPQGTGPILEAPDTGTYERPRKEMMAGMSYLSGPVPVELPAEMPAQDLSELMRKDTVASRSESQKNEEGWGREPKMEGLESKT